MPLSFVFMEPLFYYAKNVFVVVYGFGFTKKMILIILVLNVALLEQNKSSGQLSKAKLSNFIVGMC